MFRMKVSASISISIHAPPRGATRALQFHPCYLQFQFTPLREGRQVVNRAVEASADFNSRPSARGDGGFPAPVPRHSFQFTPLREGRRIVQSSLVNRNRFQFTPLREGRRFTVAVAICTLTFQFTPLREGRLSEITEAMNMLEISIHAPPRGATLQVVQ